MTSGVCQYRSRGERKRERQERLELIERQVADGSLTIRPMTGAERERWGLPPADDALAPTAGAIDEGAAA